jgi:hypothetical protein
MAGGRQPGAAAAAAAARANQSTSANADQNTSAVSNIQVRKDDKDIIVIPIFNGTNYSIWSSTMEVFLDYCGLWSLCKEDPEEPLDNQTRKQTLKAWLILSSKIKPNIFNSIKLTCGRSAHKIWEKLKSNYATALIYGIY